jgi:hypothetical protein
MAMYEIVPRKSAVPSENLNCMSTVERLYCPRKSETSLLA